MNTILLFYKYVDIQYPKQVMKHQRSLCEELDLKGRILIAHEGINATVSGTRQATERYKEYMNNHELFSGIDFKESEGTESDFPRLRVVVKNEIVHLGLDPQTVKACDGGKHLTPEEAHALMQANPEDLVILDARNDYESRVGTFKNAITPPIKTFREFPDYVDQNTDLIKDKQVLMFCTGGIRCERASTHVKQKGVAKNVYQILGGIHRYVEKFPEGFFRGKNYVFDGRVSVRVNDDVLTTCDWCKKPCDDYTNCMNTTCNNHYICCQACAQESHNTCCQKCKEGVVSGAVPLRKKPIPGTAEFARNGGFNGKA